MAQATDHYNGHSQYYPSSRATDAICEIRSQTLLTRTAAFAVCQVTARQRSIWRHWCPTWITPRSRPNGETAPTFAIVTSLAQHDTGGHSETMCNRVVFSYLRYSTSKLTFHHYGDKYLFSLKHTATQLTAENPGYESLEDQRNRLSSNCVKKKIKKNHQLQRSFECFICNNCP